MEYVCRTSDCIAGLRLRLIALILLFYLFSFPYFTLTLKNCVRVFSGSIEARVLELGIEMDDEVIVSWN